MSSNISEDVNNISETAAASSEDATPSTSTHAATDATQPISKQTLNEQPTDAVDFVNKLYSLEFALENDILACDAQWSLFVAATMQCKTPKQLLPSNYANNAKGRAMIVAHIYDMPKLKLMLQRLRDQDYEQLNPDLVELLYHALFPRTQFLETVKRAAWSEVLDVFDIQQQLQALARQPSHIFDVLTQDMDITEDTKYAYFAAPLANFYTIMRTGFQQVMREPYRAYPSLKLALSHAPESDGWELSALGTKLACVAICAYEDDGHSVRPKYQEGNKASCLLVNGGTALRLRYLIFFGRNLPHENQTKLHALGEWMKNNMFTLAVGCYVFMLLSIGFSNSIYMRNMQHYMRKSATSLWNSFINYLIPK